ncbi:MAG: hypothetical protein COB66_03095 [Coxiella sp. (in: Bacteria)]|nr:MAG: hypothetical protein COB66_03095 [Coxiella sp. (in: g-proteobacteria)]
MKKVNKHFVSDIDKKLAEFNASRPRSASQLSEIEKYQKIFALRDNPEVTHTSQGSIWGDDETA